MNNVENRLSEEKKRFDTITAPDDLEKRLRNALNKTSVKRRKTLSSFWKLTAAALICFVLVGYNFNAFAYYSKKLLGFDDIMSGTLQNLNEHGMGHVIDKNLTLNDGTVLTIDGIMTDANQLIMYYTLSNKDGFQDISEVTFRPTKISGFLTNSNPNSGVSTLNEEIMEVKGEMTFDPVSPWARNLTLHFWDATQSYTISFPYNPNQAMQTQLKKSIKQSVAVDKGTITFQSITATPTSTIVKGKMNVENFDRLSLGLQGIELVVNGSRVDQLGSGVTTGTRGTTFEITYDALPEQVDSIELIVKSFIGYKEVNATIPITAETEWEVGGHSIWIEEVSVTTRGVEITFATSYDVLLDGVTIQKDNEIIPLQRAVNHQERKLENGQIINQRTMIFDASFHPENLRIKGIHYIKEYNDSIKIVKR